MVIWLNLDVLLRCLSVWTLMAGKGKVVRDNNGESKVC